MSMLLKNYQMKRIIPAIVIIIVISCHKVPDTAQLANSFAVITNRDKTVVFNDYKNFFISDTVSYISTVPGDDSIIVGNPAQVLVNAVKNNLRSNGYILVSSRSNPDLGVKITAIKQVDAGVIYPPGWWWRYPGYPGDCYWGFCYPGSYPYPFVYAYHVGDLIIEVYDLKNALSNHALHVIWLANVEGVLHSISQEDIDKAILGIDQAFAQSPYFKTN